MPIFFARARRGEISRSNLWEGLIPTRRPAEYRHYQTAINGAGYPAGEGVPNGESATCLLRSLLSRLTESRMRNGSRENAACRQAVEHPSEIVKRLFDRTG